MGALCAPAALAAGEDHAAGLPKSIEWRTLADLRSPDFADNDKPVMYLFTQPWCALAARRAASRPSQPRVHWLLVAPASVKARRGGA